MVMPAKQATHKTWVWDAALRLGHWLLAICFATAYATGESESWRLWHIYSGNGVLAIVIFRLIWGVIGTPYARFSQFVRPPTHAVRYLKSLISHTPEHHVGHNPAGGIAVLGLLGLSATTAIIGWIIYQDSPPHWLEKAHEIAANLTLCLVAVHVVAVIISSKLHKENLIQAMITGNKPSPQVTSEANAFTLGKVTIGFALLLFLLAFAGYAVTVWS